MAQMDYIKAKLDLLKIVITAIIGAVFALVIYDVQTQGANAIVVVLSIASLSIVLIFLGATYRKSMNELKELPIEVVVIHNESQDKSMMSAQNKKTKIRQLAEYEFKKDLEKPYQQLGADGYDEILQEDRNLPDNKDEQIRLITLDNENIKHAIKRMFAFSGKMGLENQKTQRWIQGLTIIMVILMSIQLYLIYIYRSST